MQGWTLRSEHLPPSSTHVQTQGEGLEDRVDQQFSVPVDARISWAASKPILGAGGMLWQSGYHLRRPGLHRPRRPGLRWSEIQPATQHKFNHSRSAPTWETRLSPRRLASISLSHVCCSCSKYQQIEKSLFFWLLNKFRKQKQNHENPVAVVRSSRTRVADPSVWMGCSLGLLLSPESGLLTCGSSEAVQLDSGCSKSQLAPREVSEPIFSLSISHGRELDCSLLFPKKCQESRG